jgi:hypothetical protein
MTFDINLRVFFKKTQYKLVWIGTILEITIDNKHLKVFKVQWDKNNTNSSALPKNLCRGRDIGELYTLQTLTLEERNQFILERNKIVDSNLFKKNK